jgi:hypothetical protein
MRDGSSCKTKWHQILLDYKKIAHYHSRIGTNSLDYWEQSDAESIAGGLPRLFSQELFNQLHEWNGTMSHITPPHVRDLLASNDGNYCPEDDDAQHSEGEDIDGSVLALEDPPPTVHFGFGDSQEFLPASPLHARAGPSKCPPIVAAGPAPMPKRSTCNISATHPPDTAHGTSLVIPHVISPHITSL